MNLNGYKYVHKNKDEQGGGSYYNKKRNSIKSFRFND